VEEKSGQVCERVEGKMREVEVMWQRESIKREQF